MKTHQSQRTASADIIESLQEDMTEIRMKRIQGDFWLLFATELMEQLPAQAVRDSFLDTYTRLQETFNSEEGNERYPYLGPYAQDALADWGREVRAVIEETKSNS